MADELICPDCGGIIGATEVTDAGKPCTCFAYLQKAKAMDEIALEALNENADLPNTENPSNQTGSAKICIKCGADVAGKKRVKDARGYMCYDCAKEERRDQRGGRIRCASCSRWAAESAIVEYEGIKICTHCHRERLEAKRKSFKRFGIRYNQTRHQKNQILMLVGIIAFLLFLVFLRRIGLLPGFW
jgi:hypothetical protein